MRKFLFLGIIICSLQIFAQPVENRYEIGVILGEPTGLSGKYWLTDHSAIDLATAWSFTQAVFELASDYQYHYFWPDFPSGQLPIYLGLGVGLQVGNRNGNEDQAFLGVRVPFGVSHLFENAPLSAFAEIAPIFELVPESDVRLAGGLGLRFTF